MASETLLRLGDGDDRITSKNLAELQRSRQLRIDKVGVELLDPDRLQVVNRKIRGKLAFSELHDFSLDLALSFNSLRCRQICHIEQKLLSNLECESLHLTRLSLCYLLVVCFTLARVNFRSMTAKFCLCCKDLKTVLALIDLVFKGHGSFWLNDLLGCRFFPRDILNNFVGLKRLFSFL